MNSKLVVAALSLAFGASWSLQAGAQVKPETLVKQRQAAMTLQGKYFGPIGAMVQGKIPYDAAVVTRNAGYLEALAKMPWDGFQASTMEVKDTAAKPEIYKEMDKFQAAYEKLQTETTKLSVAAKSADQGAVKAAWGDVAKACKACHDDYQVKK